MGKVYDKCFEWVSEEWPRRLGMDWILSLELADGWGGTVDPIRPSTERDDRRERQRLP